MSVDFAGITGKQQKVWSLGYGRVGSLLNWIGESLVRQLDVHAGERVLDVAAGNGNASLPAARRFADVLATDYVPELLEEAKRRAEVDGLALRTEVADAQKLQFKDGQFDVVMSTIGAMFAPDQEAVARELARVCRPGGRIGMANWTPESTVGDMFRAVARHVPPPAGVQPAVMWGNEARVKELLGPHCRELRLTRQTCPWRFPSPQACVDYFRTWYGPTLSAFRTLGEGAGALEKDLREVFERSNLAKDGTLALDVAYLEIVGVRA
ncbi:class I SAM-dependent methyltransferase [Aggregicoccus sp. 17bor-14]|uniref:class I SAM-dependent methyltransferase n=1 Tax=Myxococcaceae TaxID=31 RepID=UPI00129D1A90|nr:MULTISPECIES: class I SAM-dependent methyltransferase [Myxococcaceae]MBF5042452.1 class I SAM-dependent methyltransferase [Simulacricoccus sp. 17bor-14]MRI88223.1 class I SAM-dependent methyltransferase [Aggregicoccus sp. 17bor-14]